jgi:hypothetical protein
LCSSGADCRRAGHPQGRTRREERQCGCAERGHLDLCTAVFGNVDDKDKTIKPGSESGRATRSQRVCWSEASEGVAVSLIAMAAGNARRLICRPALFVVVLIGVTDPDRC